MSDVYELEGEFKRLGVENANLRAENATMMEQLSHYERLLTSNEAMVKGRICSIEGELSRFQGYANDRAELLSAMPDIELFVKHLSDDLDVCCVPMDRLLGLVRRWRASVENNEPIKQEYADLDRLRRERDALLAAAKDVLACDKDLSDARAWNEGHIEERMVAELRMVQSFAPLRLAVDACSSAARGDKR